MPLIAAALLTVAALDGLPIGRIHTLGLSARHASAVLIGPCHAMSARHLLPRGKVLGRRLRFQSGRLQSMGAVVLAGQGPNLANRQDWSADWMLVRLDDCIGFEVGFAPLAIAIATTEVIAEAWRPGRRNSYMTACRIVRYDRLALKTSCPAQPGQSGGALFSRDATSGKIVVIGLTAARSRDPRRR